MPDIDLRHIGSTATPPSSTKRDEKAEAARLKQERQLLEAERTFQAGVTTVRDLIAPAAMKVDSNFLRVGSKFVHDFVVTYRATLRWGGLPGHQFQRATGHFHVLLPDRFEIVLKRSRIRLGIWRRRL